MVWGSLGWGDGASGGDRTFLATVRFFLRCSFFCAAVFFALLFFLRCSFCVGCLGLLSFVGIKFLAGTAGRQVIRLMKSWVGVLWGRVGQGELLPRRAHTYACSFFCIAVFFALQFFLRCSFFCAAAFVWAAWGF